MRIVLAGLAGIAMAAGAAFAEAGDGRTGKSVGAAAPPLPRAVAQPAAGDVVAQDASRAIARAVNTASAATRNAVADSSVADCATDLREGCVPPADWLRMSDATYGLRAAFAPASDARVLYADGYLLRLDENDAVDTIVPLLAGALRVGLPWPRDYPSAEITPYYRDLYDLGQPENCRSTDEVLYRIDPDTRLITSVAAFLTGDEIRVGDRLPDAYGVYNVPYELRPRYRDTPETLHRYADGYVYRADRASRRVLAAFEAIR